MDKYIIPHSQTLKPYRQGQLDTLCGLYSAINAIRLAAYPTKVFTKYHARIMIEEGFEYLARRKTRLQSALIEGMSVRLRYVLLKHMITFVEDEWGVALELIKPQIDVLDAPRLIMSFIEESIKAGHPVCINIKGHHKHYTIICGYNERSFLLYDSDGLTSLRRSLISIDDNGLLTRHKLVRKGAFSIRL